MVTNNKLGTIKIRKRTPQEWMVFGLFFMPMALAFLTEFLGLPSIVRYLMDLLVVALCVTLFVGRYFTVSSKAKPILTLALIFFLYTLIIYLLNYQSIFYFLWGARNTFRFYLAFLVFVAYVTEEDANRWLQILDILFWIHFAATVYQFVVLRVHQDFLGGIFGVESGSNGYNLIFLTIVIGKALFQTFDGKEKYLSCAAKCFASLIIAAMAEMKFYYISFILILIITASLTGFSRKKVALLAAMAFGVIVGLSLLTFWFNEFEGFFSWESLWEAATKENYSSDNDLNRLSAIFTLSKNFATELTEQLFGLGLGNCDGSDLSIFNSPFYQSHSFLHYTWFASAMLFLETGFIGLTMYLLFFGLCIFYSYKQIKHNTANKLFCQMSILMAIMGIALTFYNASMRLESGYMAYFILALPFIAKSNNTGLSADEPNGEAL